MSAFTLGVGYIGIRNVSDLRDTTSLVADSGQEALQAARMNQNVLALNRAEYHIASDPSPGTIREAEETIRAQRSEFARRMQELQRDAGPQRRDELAGIGRIFDRYAAEVEETLSVARRVGSGVLLGEAQQTINTSVAQSRVVARDLQQAVRAYAERANATVDEQTAAAAAQASAANTAMLTAAGIGVAIGVAVGLLIGIAGIGRPLSRIIEVVARLARADTSVQIFGTERKDEVGDIARAMEIFKSNLEEKTQLETEAARQREERERQRQEREAREAKAGEEIAALCEQIANGDLTKRIGIGDKEGFLLVMAEQMNHLSGMLQSITDEQSRIVSALADGDLTSRIDGQYEGVFGQIKQDMNAMIESLHSMVSKVANTVDSLKSAAGEISAGSKDLSQRTESQAASLEETAASMHQVTTMVQNNAENAGAANQLSTVARDTAQKGGNVVRDVVQAMGRIEDSAKKISDIVGLIDEIAFQTNLLALNASVEAARAGEAGKGFAVVAQEVRALAQRSANASKDIKALIQESNAQVRTGAGLVDQAGKSLGEIVEAVMKVADIVSEISAASKEQATGLNEINTAVANMDEMTQRNSSLVEETSAAAESLSEQSTELAGLVSTFRLGDSQDDTVVPLRRSARRPASQAATSTQKRTAAPPARPLARAVKAEKPMQTENGEWAEF